MHDFKLSRHLLGFETPRTCISWDEAWHIVERAVERGQRPRVTPHLGVDEKAIAKGHQYLTLVCDVDRATVDYLPEDRQQASREGYTSRAWRRTGWPAARRSPWICGSPLARSFRLGVPTRGRCIDRATATRPRVASPGGSSLLARYATAGFPVQCTIGCPPDTLCACPFEHGCPCVSDGIPLETSRVGRRPQQDASEPAVSRGMRPALFTLATRPAGPRPDGRVEPSRASSIGGVPEGDPP
jgi:hypothetical protein